ncbi:MAG: acetate--CoA ligase family protein [Coriobacteriales bacterium]|nr:acetate--CoA ligase family protein [Coriobacteriales bacterium]
MLDGFFRPTSVAVVGVARDPGKVGHFVFRNILDAGFEGALYPVNPNATEILGHRAYPSLRDLPGPVDLVVVAVPAPAVAQVIDDAAAADIDSAIVLSAGFKETGPAGARLEREIVERARAGGVRVLGPNSLGLVSTPGALDAAFAGARPRHGSVAMLSQSGALGTALLDKAADGPPGLAYFVSLGNRSDLAEDELLEAWCDDDAVSVVGAYLESVSDGDAFVRAAGDLAQVKPLLVLKAGSSDAGARAVSSHTGSLAGSDVAYDAALHATGALRVRDIEELLDGLSAFAMQPIPAGRGVAILTNAGGLGVLATDAAERFGVELAGLDRCTVEALQASLPPAAAFYNPVDILGDADPERFGVAARALAADDEVASIIVMLTPQAMTQPLQTARLVAEAVANGPTTLACLAGGDSLEPARDALREAGIPVFESPERAVRALSLMERWAARPEKHLRDRGEVEGIDHERIAAIIEASRAQGREFVTDADAAAVAASCGIPVPGGGLAEDLEHAREIALLVGYPVVLKIVSPDILHKSDVGGVIAGIADEAELASAYQELRNRVQRRAQHAWVQGVYVQAMVPAGRELIVGTDRDPTFGPLLMVGLGGVLVEVLRDVTFRICPVTDAEAKEMFAELRGYPILKGVRGSGAADLDAAAHLVSRVSELACSTPDILEMDINPVIVGDVGEGALAVDIRIGIGG